MRHPVAFREYFTPKVSKRRYWQRYTFMPVILAMGQGDTLLAAGRGSGKSLAGIEPEIVRQAIARPGEETIVTTLRKIHVTDRMERAIQYFEEIPLLRIFLKRVTRNPGYHVQLNTGHSIYGLSVGDDPEARMAQGKHASSLFFEEAHQYPTRAYMKIQGAQDMRGSWKLMVGVPDGRIDTPFRNADKTYRTYAGRRFHITSRSDPFFDQRLKAEKEETLGGENSEFFMQEVDAKWGSPSFSAWNLDQVFACMEPPSALPEIVLRIEGKVYRSLRSEIGDAAPTVLCRELPGPRFEGSQVRISVDVGYSQPTEIGIHEFYRDRWHMTARVELLNKVEFDEACEIIDHLGDRYGAEQIGLDTTDGQGRAMAQQLETRYPRWAPRVSGVETYSPIIRVSFTDSAIFGYTMEEDQHGEFKAREQKDTVKQISVRKLRDMISRKEVAWPNDDRITSDFNQEREARGADGVIRLITPPTVHIPEMLRVLAYMVFKDTPPVPPEDIRGRKRGFMLPEWSRTGVFERVAV